MNDKLIAIREACSHYKYKWPHSLPSGIMFWRGWEITIREFNNFAKDFK